MDEEEIKALLLDYISTANDPKNGGDWSKIDSLFQEFESYDKDKLHNYVNTYNGGVTNISKLNTQFPDFFPVKKKDLSDQNASSSSFSDGTEGSSGSPSVLPQSPLDSDSPQRNEVAPGTRVNIPVDTSNSTPFIADFLKEHNWYTSGKEGSSDKEDPSDKYSSLRISPDEYSAVIQNAGSSVLSDEFGSYSESLDSNANDILYGIVNHEIDINLGIAKLSKILAEDDYVVEQLGIDVPTKNHFMQPSVVGVSIPPLDRNPEDIFKDREYEIKKLLNKKVYARLSSDISQIIPENLRGEEGKEYLEQYMLEEFGAMADIDEDGQVGNTPFLQFDGFKVFNSGDVTTVIPEFSGYLPDKLKAAAIDLTNGFINFWSSDQTIKDRREEAEKLRRETLQFVDGAGEGDLTNAILLTTGYIAEAIPTLSVTLPLAVVTAGALPSASILTYSGIIALESASVATLQEAARLRANPEWSIYIKDGEEYSYQEMMMATGGDPELILQYTEDPNISGKAGYIADTFGSSFVVDGATSLIFMRSMKGQKIHGPVHRDAARWWRYHAATAGLSTGVGSVAGSFAAGRMYMSEKEAKGEEPIWSEMREVMIDAAIQTAGLGFSVSGAGSFLNIALSRDPFGRGNENMSVLNEQNTILKNLIKAQEKNNKKLQEVLLKDLIDLKKKSDNRRVQDEAFYERMNPEDKEFISDLSKKARVKLRDVYKINRKESTVSQKLVEEINALVEERLRIESLYDLEYDYYQESIKNDPLWDEAPPIEFSTPLRGFSTKDKLRAALIDKYDGIRKIQQEIQTQRDDGTGQRVPLDQDIDISLRLWDSQAKAVVELMETTLAKDLYPTLIDLNSVISKDTPGAEMLPAGQKPTSTNMFGRYMYAKHAPERNADISRKISIQLTDINKKIADSDNESSRNKLIKERDRLIEYQTSKNGSGMSDETAKAYLDRLEPNITERFEKAHEVVKRLQQETRDKLLEYGFINKEQHRYLNAKFENYVTLHGKAIQITDESGFLIETDADYQQSAPYSIRDNFIREALGRGDETTDILAKIIQQNTLVNVLGKKNIALQKVYELARRNPDPKVWQILGEKDLLQGGKRDGTKAKSDHIVKIMIDGDTKKLYFEDVDIAISLRDMNEGKSTWFIQKIKEGAVWTSGLRKMFVNYNPVYGPAAFFRDAQTAIIQGYSLATKEFGYALRAQDGSEVNASALIAGMMKNLPNSLRVATQAEFKTNMSPENRKFHAEYRKYGGQTGMIYAQPLLEINKILEGQTNPNKFKIARKWLFDNSLGLVESMNGSLENAIRFSAYKTCRENGISPENSAAVAKYVTVDFNRRGNSSAQIGSIKYFFNPAVQGIDQLVETTTAKSPKIRFDGTERPEISRYGTEVKLLGGLVAFGAALTSWNLSITEKNIVGMSFYDEIPDYVKRRNFIIMHPMGTDTTKQGYTKIPKAYGYSVFSDLGATSVEVLTNNRNSFNASMYMAASGAQAFSPLNLYSSQKESSDKTSRIVPSPSDIIAGVVTPDQIKPVLDTWRNVSVFGNQITSPNEPGKSRSGGSYRAPLFLREAAENFNELGGGTEFTSGSVYPGISTDHNPDYLYYIFQQYMGGGALALTQTMDVVRDWRTLRVKDFPKTGNNILDPDNIPFFRSFYSDGNSRTITTEYFDIQDRIKGYQKEWSDKMNLADYIALELPYQDQSLSDDGELMSDESRFLKYIKVNRLINTLNNLMYNPRGLGLMKDRMIERRDSLNATMFSSDEDLKKFYEIEQEIYDHEAQKIGLMALVINLTGFRSEKDPIIKPEIKLKDDNE